MSARAAAAVPVPLQVAPLPDPMLANPTTIEPDSVPIISAPHLVGMRQRLGALLFSLCCWLYFLVPVAVLGGWLAGYSKLAKEVVLLGGWRRFQHLMEMSGRTILILVAMWIAWSIYLLLQRSRPPEPPKMVDDATLSGFFGIAPEQLDGYRQAQLLTIHFEDDGRYRELVPGRPGGIPGRPETA